MASNMITGTRRKTPIQAATRDNDGRIVEHTGGLKLVNPLLFADGRVYVGPQVVKDVKSEMKTKDNATLDVTFDYTFQITDARKAYYNTNRLDNLENIVEAEVWDAIKAEINETDYEDVVRSLPDMRDRIIQRVNESMNELYGVSLLKVYVKEPIPKEKRLEDALNQQIISSLKADSANKDVQRISDVANGILKNIIAAHEEQDPSAPLPDIDIQDVYMQAMHHIRILDTIAAETTQSVILDASRRGDAGGFTGGMAATASRAPTVEPANVAPPTVQ